MKRNGAILDLFRRHEEKARKIAHHTEDIINVWCPNSPPPIHSDADMDTDTEIDVEIEDATASLPSPQQPSEHVFLGDIGKKLLFQSMLLMIKIVFEEDTLQKLHADHMHMLFKSGKSMVKIDTLVLFGLKSTVG